MVTLDIPTPEEELKRLHSLQRKIEEQAVYLGGKDLKMWETFQRLENPYRLTLLHMTERSREKMGRFQDYLNGAQPSNGLQSDEERRDYDALDISSMKAIEFLRRYAYLQARWKIPSLPEGIPMEAGMAFVFHTGGFERHSPLKDGTTYICASDDAVRTGEGEVLKYRPLATDVKAASTMQILLAHMSNNSFYLKDPVTQISE